MWLESQAASIKSKHCNNYKMEKEKKSVEERFAEFEERLKAGKEAEDDLEIRDALLEKGRLLIDENRLVSLQLNLG